MSKIIFLINSLKLGGGAEKVLVEILEGLSSKKVKPQLVLSTFYKIKSNESYKVNTKIYIPHYCANETYVKNPFVKILKMIRRVIFLYKVIKKEKATYVVSFLEEPNFTNSLLKLLLRDKYRAYLSIHRNPKTYNIFYKTLIFLLYRFSDKILPVSKEIANYLTKEFKIPKEKVHVIYNPINIRETLKKSKEKVNLKVGKEDFVFLNVGRLTEAKGQWFLIRAFKKVVEKYPNTKLIILGEGELKEKLQELINKLNLQNNVFLLGVQKNPFPYYKKADVFVFSSIYEAMPRVLLEALSLNLPVISTDCKTGPREILAPELPLEKEIDYPYFGRYGILTKTFPRKFVFKDLKEEPLSKEEEMLADLMIKMIGNEDLRKKYSNGLERAKDFDIEKIIKEWQVLLGIPEASLECPFCKQKESFLYLGKEYSYLSRKFYYLFRCPKCQLEFFYPLEFKRDIYEEEKLPAYKEFHNKRKTYPPWSLEAVEVIKEHNLINKDSKVLEVGSGDCINFQLLREKLNLKPENYFAIELDKKSISVCLTRKIKKENLINSELNNEIAKRFKEKFDLILALEVLEHQTNPKEFLKNLSIMLRKGGHLVITVPNKDRKYRTKLDLIYDRPPHHFLRFGVEFFILNFLFPKDNDLNLQLKSFGNFSYLKLENIRKLPFIKKLLFPFYFLINRKNLLDKKGLIVVLRKI